MCTAKPSVFSPRRHKDRAKDALNVFVYGTLKPGGRFHDTICSPYPLSATKAWVNGRLFDFPDRGYPAAAEDPHSRIYGYVLSFEQPGQNLLRALDELEGYNPHGSPQDNLYYRLTVSAWTNNRGSRPITAWCYFMTPERINAYGGVELTHGRWP